MFCKTVELLSRNVYNGVMEQEVKRMIVDIKGFRLPRYQQIPDVGLYLEQVAEDSPAKEAGLQPGDILTAVDGTALTESSTLWQQLLMHESGDSITVTLQRLVQEKYEEMELDVELGGR